MVGGVCMQCSYAFIPSLQMSSVREQPRRQRQSSSYRKLSSLLSTPFPNSVNRAGANHQAQYNVNATTSYYNEMGDDNGFNYYDDDDDDDEMINSRYTRRQSPFPDMPSQLFTSLAMSQFELLSNSLIHGANDDNNNINMNKISSMVLYLPKENTKTGALEFVPAVSYPLEERIFYASSDSSNQPPSIPPTGVVGLLPGFFSARSVIPSYPFVSSSSSSDNTDGEDTEMFTTVSQDNSVSVSAVEEIVLPSSTNDASFNPTPSLSITLFSGLDTLGVLMIWPMKSNDSNQQSNWTSNDKLQITRAAKSLALALSMDNERASTQLANEQFCVAMADSLHQVKSPLQALRTFGKLLQQQLAEDNVANSDRPVPQRVPMTARGQQQALKLAENMMSQGERVIGLIEPMDMLVQNAPYLLQGDVKDNKTSATSGMVQYQLPPSMPDVFGDFDLEIAFPQDILGALVYQYQAVSREKGINFDVVGLEPDADLPGVTISPRHLQEAVSNILDNAIKYVTVRPQGKKGRPRIPQIKVSMISNKSPLQAGVTLIIEDNGQASIEKSERDKVFERGYRSEATQDVDGSGLGLPIAKEMITRMGGMIDVIDDGPNKLDGTCVLIILFREPDL